MAIYTGNGSGVTPSQLNSAYIQPLIGEDNILTVTPALSGYTVVIGNVDDDINVVLPNNIFISRYTLVNFNNGIAGVTVDVAGTIGGQSRILMGYGDSITVVGNGGTYAITNSWLQPANCFVSLSLGQNIPANTTTTLQFDSIGFNVGNFYDAETFTYLPRLPGKYLITFDVGIDTTAATGVALLSAYILQNAAPIQGIGGSNLLVNTTSLFNGSVLVNMNGESDYLTVAASQDSVGDPDLTLVQGSNFSALRVGFF